MNNSIQSVAINQTSSFLFIKSNLFGFSQTSARTGTTASCRVGHVFSGNLELQASDRRCPVCGAYMHQHGSCLQKLRHLPFGAGVTEVHFDRVRLKCSNPKCQASKMQTVHFKSDNHLITRELERYVVELLALEKYTLKQVGVLTGLDRHTVKEIDDRRVEGLYTIDGKTLIQPERQARFLAIDEFKLHNNHSYATHIIDLETGHILWIEQGKKKSVVYNFIKHVGLDWMDHVEAVACDMNSDFTEAFLEKCPHIDIVFDFFHIMKNLNEKVIANVRKDEQRRLIAEGKPEEAKALKGCKYILTSSAATRAKKDEAAALCETKRKGSELFNTPTVFCTGNNEELYQKLIKNNTKFFKLDLIKEALKRAYTSDSWTEMANHIDTIIKICNSEDDKHFAWFSKLILNHYDGIISRPLYKISSGKIEGINNKIKTLRRMCYGLPDDKYFFLKLMDMSRVKYVRDIKSHRILP